MEISGVGLIFGCGCLGGVAIELLRWWKLRESLEFPVFATKPTYWLITLIMIAVGGGLAVVYTNGMATVPLAMHIGASTPAILGALAARPWTPDGAADRQFGGSSRTLDRLRSFLAFGH